MNDTHSTLASRIDKFIDEHEILAVILMMITASILLCHSFFTVYPLHTTTDELGAIVGAATLAGYDWSGVIDKCGYYGFGFYSLFAPLFKYHMSPIVIYRIILVITRILRGSAISGIAYYIGKHFYKFSSKIELIILSIMCTIPLHPLNYANIINDVVLDIYLWVIILSLCKIIENIENKSRCIKWIILYSISIFWCLFIHTRALVIVISTFLVLLGLLLYKKKIKVLLTALAVPIIVIMSKFLITAYQEEIWTASGDALRNASVSVAKSIPLQDIKTWEIWFDILLGNITVQLLLTGGLFWLVIVVTVKYIYELIIKKQKEGTLYINIVLAVSVLCMGAAMAAFLVSGWFMNMYDTWDTVEKGKAYSYKALCYVRYWNVFAMPFLFTGVYLASKKEYRDCIYKAILSGIIVLIAFIEIIIPIVQNNSSAGSFLFTYLTDETEKVTDQFYYKSILLCIAFLAVSVAIYFGKFSKEWSILPILILMVIGYNQANANYNRPVTEKISSMVLASYDEKCQLENSGVNIGQIYAFDDRKVDSNWYIFSVLQFYFYEYRIEDEYPKEMQDDDIIITYGRSERIESDFPQLKCYQLDDNEVWYTDLDLIGYVPIEN